MRPFEFLHVEHKCFSIPFNAIITNKNGEFAVALLTLFFYVGGKRSNLATTFLSSLYFIAFHTHTDLYYWGGPFGTTISDYTKLLLDLHTVCNNYLSSPIPSYGSIGFVYY